MSKFPLSYSRVATFKKCPAEFEALYVNKSVQFTPNEHTLYGNRVHESLEWYGKTGDESKLTKETRKWKPLVDKILSNDGDKYFEKKVAIDADCKPCGWFDDSVWFRGIFDILVVNGSVAYCGDWKTGKSAYENPVQLQIFAALVFFHYPEVEQVRCDFLWLVEDKHTKLVFDRKHLNTMWGRLSDQFAVVQEAVDLGVFVAKPSRLCGWCSAKDICVYK